MSFSSDDEWFDNRSPAAARRRHSEFTGAAMKAPSSRLRASLEELNYMNNNGGDGSAAAERSRRQNNMSDKIDDFLGVVQRCEFELHEEYELRKRRLAEAKVRRMRGSVADSMSSSVAMRRPYQRSASSFSINTVNGRRSVNTTISNASIARSRQSATARQSVASSKAKTNSVTSAARAYGTASKSSTRVPQSMPVKPPPLALTARPQRKPPKRRPGTAQTFASSTIRQPLRAVPDFPVPDTSKVESRLKQDRDVYQPPRRRKPQRSVRIGSSTKSSTQHRTQERQRGGGETHDTDYDDDFEEDEADEEEDEEERDMMMTKQWLDDQAQRGMARQRAMQMASAAPGKYGHIRMQDSHEKESSKDSAYGYSGGESRLQTREPTPDTWQMKQQLQMAAGKVVNGTNFHRGSRQQQRQQNHGIIGRYAMTRSGRDSTSEAEENTKSSAYVDFINRVTGEILKRGVFTDRTVRDVIEHQVTKWNNSGGGTAMTKKEVDMLLSKLKKELGLSKSTPSAGTSTAGSLAASYSDTNLHDVLYNVRRQEKMSNELLRRQSRPKSGRLGSSYSGIPSSGVPGRVASSSADRISERELSDILHDVDLDDSTVEEVLRAIKRSNYPSAPSQSRQPQFQLSVSSASDDRMLGSAGNLRPLFDHMNITDLNISFNTKGEQAAKEKRSQQRALLIKSFAMNHKSPEPGSSGGKSRPRSAIPVKKHSTLSAAGRKSSAFRPISAGRQDSSSSNPDLAVASKGSAAAGVGGANRPKSSGARKKSVSAAAKKDDSRGVTSQMPDTPLHSSETPRSSDLYQPESEDEDAALAPATGDVGNDSDISEDVEGDRDDDGRGSALAEEINYSEGSNSSSSGGGGDSDRSVSSRNSSSAASAS